MMKLRMTIYDLRLALRKQRCVASFFNPQSAIRNPQFVAQLFSAPISK